MLTPLIDFSPLNFVETCETITENTYFQNVDAVNATDTQYTYTLTDVDQVQYCYSTLRSFIGIMMMIGIFVGMVVLLVVLINKRHFFWGKK